MRGTRHTAAIVGLAVAKSAATRQRVRAAIQALGQAGAPVNFTTVGKAAGVSKTFLYDPKHADLAQEIRQLRTVVPPERAALPPRGKSEVAKDAQIARLTERVRLLEQQLRTLHQENELLYGKLADQGPRSDH